MPTYDYTDETGTYSLESPKDLNGDEVLDYFVKAGIAKPKPEKPFWKTGDVLNALGDVATNIIPSTWAGIRRGWEGIQPEHSQSYMDTMRADAARSQAVLEENRQREQAGDLSVVGENIRGIVPSLGFTTASIPATIIGAKTGGSLGLRGAALAGQPELAPAASVVGAGVGGLAAGFGAAYRMMGAQFMDDAMEAFEQKSLRELNRPLTTEERKKIFEDLRPVAENTALWEAAPEAIGNLATLGAGKVILGIGKPAFKALVRSAQAKVLAGGAAFGTELTTEGITEYGQDTDRAKLEAYQQGLPMEGVQGKYQGAEGLLEATKEVAPSVTTLSALMLGAGGAVKLASNALSKKGEFTTEQLDQIVGASLAQANKELADAQAATDVSNYQRNLGIARASAKVESAQKAAEYRDEGDYDAVATMFGGKHIGAGAPVDAALEADTIAAEVLQQSAQNLAAIGSEQSAAATQEFLETANEVFEAQAAQPPVQPSETQQAPSPATEMTEKPSQTITGSNVQTGTEMPVPGESTVTSPGEAPLVTPEEESLAGTPVQAASIESIELPTDSSDAIKGIVKRHDSLFKNLRNAGVDVRLSRPSEAAETKGVFWVNETDEGKLELVLDEKNAEKTEAFGLTDQAIFHETVHAAQALFDRDNQFLSTQADKVFDPNSSEFDQELDSFMANEVPSWSKIRGTRNAKYEAVRALLEAKHLNKTSRSFRPGMPFVRYLSQFIEWAKANVFSFGTAKNKKFSLYVNKIDRLLNSILPPIQPVETQEDAPSEIPLQESLPEEPQDRVESREVEEAGVGDQLRGAEESEEVNQLSKELNDLPLRGKALNSEANAANITDLGNRIAQSGNAELIESALVGFEDAIGFIKGRTEGSKKVKAALAEQVEKLRQAQITPQGKPTPATEGKVTPGGVATERETDEERFQRIKNISPSQRTDEDIAFANAFSKRQKELKPQAGETTRKAFISSHTASIGGRLRKALDQGMNFRGLKGTVGSWVETLYNEGWRMALDARGNRQFTNGTEALGSSGLGKVGMNYADFLSSQPQTTAAETQTPESLRVDSGAAGVVQSEPVEGSIPTDEKESAKNAIESTEKSLEQPGYGAKLNAIRKSIRDLGPDSQKAQTQALNDLMAMPLADLQAAFEVVTGIPTKQANKRQLANNVLNEILAESRNEKLPEADETFRKAEIEAEEEIQRQNAQSLARIFNDKLRTSPVKGLVSSGDVERAIGQLQNSGEVPGAIFTWRGTAKELQRLAKTPAFKRAFPGAAQAAEQGNVEGIYENGMAFVITDQVVITDLDRARAKIEGTTPTVAAVKRVISHENYHKGVALLSPKDQAKLVSLLRKLFPAAELDDLAKSYKQYADWRTNRASEYALLEEKMQKAIEEMKEVPRDGLLRELVDFLKAIWRKWTGQPKGEPRLRDLKDVVRLLRSTLKDSHKAQANRTANGGRVMMSLPAFRNFVPAVQINGRIETGMSHYEAWLKHAIRQIPNYKKDGLSDAEVKNLADKWLVDHPEVMANSMTREGFMTDEGYLNRQDSLKKFLALGGKQRLDPGEVRDWLDSADVDSARMSLGANMIDAEYLEAVANGDMEKAQRMVDEAAKKAGGIFVYQGVGNGGEIVGNVFNKDTIGKSGSDLSKQGYFFTKSKEVADNYARVSKGKTKEFFIFPKNTLEADQFFNFDPSRHFNTGGDSVLFKNVTDVWGPSDNYMVGVGHENQIKSADPITYDDAGNVIPLSQRFQPSSPDIRFSLATPVEYSSTNNELASSAQQTARNIEYTPRQLEVHFAVRKAYDAMPKDNGVAVPLFELFDKTKEFVPDLNAQEFSEIVQGLYDDNGALLHKGESEFNVLNRDNEPASSVVILPGKGMASLGTALSPEEYARHAELEAKNKAGTITPEETKEAEKLVEKAAKAAGFKTKAHHKTWERFNAFIHGGNLQETRQWLGKNGNTRTLIGKSGKGFFFSLDRDNTPAYHNQKKTGEKILDVYLKYRNPLVFDKDTKEWAIAVFGDGNPEFPRILTNEAYDFVKQDYDSIELYNKGYSHESKPDEVIVLDPNQIKSADPFTGVPLEQRFDVTSPDIRFSYGSADSSAAATYRNEVDVISKGLPVGREYQGAPMKGMTVEDHATFNQNAMGDAAERLLKSLSKDHSMEEIFELLQQPDFQRELGLFDPTMVKSDAAKLTYLKLVAQFKQLAWIASNKAKTEGQRIKANVLYRQVSQYYANLTTGGGQYLQSIQDIHDDPRSRFAFEIERYEKEMNDANAEAVENQAGPEGMNPVKSDINTMINESGENAATDVLEDVEEDQDAIDLAEGEATLEDPEKSLYEEYKDLLREEGILARLDKEEMDTGAKMSISPERRSELAGLTKEERAKLREKNRKRRMEILSKLLGREEEAKTPEQKTTRKKREKMVQTIEKRAKSGKSIDPAVKEAAEIEMAEKTASQIVYRFEELYRQGFKNPPQGMTKKEQKDSIIKAFRDQVKNPTSFEDFAARLADLKVGEEVAERLFLTASRERADLIRVKDFRIKKRKVEIADKQASRLIYATEERLRQGSKDLNKSKDGDSINKAFRDQVENPVSESDFLKRLDKLNVTQDVASRLFKTAAREKADQEAMAAYDMLQGPDALKKMLREIQDMRRGEEIPFRTPIPWRELLSQKAKTVDEYRKRIFDAVSANKDLQNLSDEQKNRLAKLFADAWEAKREAILKQMLDKYSANLEQQKETRKLAKALKDSRNQLLELVNLGAYNNDELVRAIGERFGLKTEFTAEEKAKLNELADKLQDDTLNRAKRNKLAREYLSLLESATGIPASELLSMIWVTSVLNGGGTIFSIATSFLNGFYVIMGNHAARAWTELARGNYKEAVDIMLDTFKAMSKWLQSYAPSAERAWNYLWTGDVSLLEAAANDPFQHVKTLGDIQRHQANAERLAKDPKLVKQYIGRYLRFWGRLLTALDAFNVMTNKAAGMALAMRQSGLTSEQIKEIDAAHDMAVFKKRIIETDPFFKGQKPTDSFGRAYLHSLAEAEMYASLAKMGVQVENADFMASESAYTMNPTGVGGIFYNFVKSVDTKATNFTKDFMKRAEAHWAKEKNWDTGWEMFLAHLAQFLSYQVVNAFGLRFARFAGNKFNQGLSFIPGVGLLRRRELSNEHLKGREQAFIDSIKRNQIAGLLLGVIGYSLLKAVVDEPDDEKRGWGINGGFNNLNPDQKRQKLARGEKEYTIRIGNLVWNYQNSPIAQPLAAIGAMADMIRFSPDKWKGKNVGDKLMSSALSGLKATLEIPALTQIGELLGTGVSSKDPTEQTQNRLVRAIAGWSGGFMPRFLKDIDYMAEPTMRKYETFWQKTSSHIPVYRRYTGKDFYDILGNPVEKNAIPGSREFAKLDERPEYQILGALNSRGIWLTPANAEYRMIGKGRNRRRLTQEEADKYSLESGKEYRKMLIRYGARALRMPPEKAKNYISDLADKARDRALDRVARR